MIPGRVARLSEEVRASATSIGPVTSDVVKVTGSTQVETILPAFGGQVYGQQIILIPTNGSLVLGASGNILVGITAAQNRGVWMAFVPSLGKWVINSGV
jgi:hypothetical protein